MISFSAGDSENRSHKRKENLNTRNRSELKKWIQWKRCARYFKTFVVTRWRVICQQLTKSSILSPVELRMHYIECIGTPHPDRDELHHHHMPESEISNTSASTPSDYWLNFEPRVWTWVLGCERFRERSRRWGNRIHHSVEWGVIRVDSSKKLRTNCSAGIARSIGKCTAE